MSLRSDCVTTAILVAVLSGCSGKNDDNSKKADPGAAEKSSPKQASSPQGDVSAAQVVLEEFLKPGADHAALTKKLEPTSADYAVVFQADFAKKAEQTYGPAWTQGAIVAAPKAGQTDILLDSATSSDLKAWNEKAKGFPGGYQEVAPQFNDGVTVYRFKFVEPGQSIGMAWDGLIFVNGNWRLFPKPWRIR